MSLKICVLGSGSKGNCTCVYGEETALLIDIGLPLIRVEKCLRLFSINPAQVKVLVTHAHSDHVSGICKFVKKYGNVVYATEQTKEELIVKYDVPSESIKVISAGDFFVGEFVISPFKLSHDVPCVGYVIENNGRRIAVATDVGKLSDSNVKKLCGADLVVLESNHDEDMLLANDKYAYYLKNRILSDKGHLSNESCAECAVRLAKNGVKQIILAHLSQENNLPELAFSTVRDKLEANGFCTSSAIRLEVATQDKMSGLYEIV